MKRFLFILGGLIFATAAVGGIKEVVWHFYTPPQIVGFSTEKHFLEDIGGKGLENLAEEWLENYQEKLSGWKVPYEYRVFDIEKISVAELDMEGYVQIDYRVIPESTNLKSMNFLELARTEEGYIGQKVLRWEKRDGKWIVREKLRPVQYQLRTPQMQEEIRTPQTEHYAMEDEINTYVIRDEKLYITYDGGKTLEEVPNGYERVCGQSNSIYKEWLPYNSYVITPEFTAFLGYEGEEAVLLYSQDAGETWKKSRISQGYCANSFVSKTENTCYVSFAVDRTGGSDYYVMMKSTDLDTWTRIQMEDSCISNYSLVYWADDNTGYVARRNEEGIFYVTVDGGASFVQAAYTEPENIVKKLGVNPFDQVEKMYRENGKTYMIVGQGDDGDYVKDGQLVKALYESANGKDFTFVKEIFDSPVETG